MHPLQIILAKVASRDTRLVGNHDQAKTQFLQGAQTESDIFIEVQFFGARRIMCRMDQCSIAVKKDGPAFHHSYSSFVVSEDARFASLRLLEILLLAGAVSCDSVISQRRCVK